MDAGGLTQLGTAVARALGTLGGVVVLVVVCWQCFKVLLSGSDRALLQAGKTLLVVGIALAALSQPLVVLDLTKLLGQAIWGALADAVRASLAAPPV
jgi:uncharacterized membrane protein YdfJ with MMPL/SSD domain